MRWLVWWLRSCFCSHEWEYEERVYDKFDEYKGSFLYTDKNKIRVSATCKKCGWHRSYWKFV